MNKKNLNNHLANSAEIAKQKIRENLQLIEKELGLTTEEDLKNFIYLWASGDFKSWRNFSLKVDIFDSEKQKLLNEWSIKKWEQIELNLKIFNKESEDFIEGQKGIKGALEEEM